MTDNMKKFMEAATEDEVLAEKLKDISDVETIRALAAEKGFILTEEDLAQPAGELSEDELDAVVGGGKCVCFLGGGGSADAHESTCACVLYGQGDFHNSLTYTGTRCVCNCAGTGRTDR